MLALIGGVHRARRSARICRSRVDWTVRRDHSAADRAGASAGELALALLYGLLTALAFALWPLGRAHDVPVGALFRDEVAPQPALAAPELYRLHGACRRCCSAALAVLLAYDRRIALIFVGAAAAVFLLLRLVAVGADGARAPRAARALDRVAHGDRQHPSARRADADRSCCRSASASRCW